MKNVTTIINRFGGLKWLQAGNYIKLENDTYEPLVIEFIGTGPRGMPLLSVAHYFEQNGDLMRDPDMTFELPVHPETGLQNFGWHPISFRQDSSGTYQEAVVQNDAGQTLIRPRLVRDLKSFASLWDRNIKEQGFLNITTNAATMV